MSRILVAGGSGFIGSHAILQLPAAGHQVRTTVRSLNAKAACVPCSRKRRAKLGYRLSFIAADLEKDAGWAEAVGGYEFVLHVASPLPRASPSTMLIVPPREGTLRAALASSVVLTSSFAAIGYGKESPECTVRRNGLDRTRWRSCGSLTEIENFGRTRGLGFRG
jgi:nucleoside-diphosphate-sugar epimerase